ncbi:putative uncharacterized protein DDB_G0286901 isoform X3 [Ceratina calcarata]|uniref:Enkurin domain-containing protein n=1 Tax=Ceratina calcarata TaxID=156304 RepID=A0AAJ7S011_9HYME|nr:putative uncharacterized protein DDB_G0286901 isoform X3 [Ceratina calcarata]
MTTLKGVFPDTKPIKGKNFIHENVKNLRRLENLHNKQDLHRSQANNRKKIKHESNVNSKLSSNKRTDENQELCKKCSAPMLNHKNNNYVKKTIHSTSNNLLLGTEKKKESSGKGSHKSGQKLKEKVVIEPDSNFSCNSDGDNADNNMEKKVTFRNQGIQTLDDKEVEELYNQKTDKNVKENLPSDRGDSNQIQNPQSKNEPVKNAKASSLKEEINFIKFNKENTAVNKTGIHANNSNNSNIIPANYRMGMVPKKEVQEKVQKTKEELDPNCPKGHLPLPDIERKETLRMLRKNYQDYVNELNMMPIKVDTLRAQRRKIEIEKQLNKLEEGIKVFSRPKVYVKMNA